jgi:hypothetical protein
MPLTTMTSFAARSPGDETDQQRPGQVAVSAELAQLAKTWTAPQPEPAPPATQPTPATVSQNRFDRD